MHVVNLATESVQVNPDSKAQVDEQPSMLFVLPSSQAKFPRLTPSPHISVQVSFDIEEPPVQVYPVST